jgi:hypothetical protein
MKWLIITSLCFLVIVAATALSEPVNVYSRDLIEQDPLKIAGEVHELGDFFPTEELIESTWKYTDETACTGEPGDDPLIPNILVEMTNLTKTNWYDVHYVADPLTTLTNYDGLIGNTGMNDGTLAFRIDYQGINIPLVVESLIVNEIFEVGETWWFIIQDYGNAFGGPPTPFDSIGIASMSSGWPPSTGSIIAIPEPATIALLGCGLVLLRRRKA